jgi:tRNA U34 5-methylaminomethyl-2-thiouridine-forming methyltransferase MnmC
MVTGRERLSPFRAVCYSGRVQSVDAYKLVRLVSGVYSVHCLECGETFHPVIGPVAEAQALYVDQLRLPERLRAHNGEFVIWDVGLGAAANALAVLRATRSICCPVRVVSFDHTPGPLRFALRHARELGYFDGYEDVCGRLASQSVPAIDFTDGRRAVHWQVYWEDFPELLKKPACESIPKPHAILFDAFSPARNPAMWTLPLFQDLYRLLDPGRACALPTYSRSTLLRTTLLLAGFFVGCGHATGEKEETTIAANTAELIAEPLDWRWLRRVRNSTSAEPLHSPEYVQSPLTTGSWERLLAHPQFRGGDAT